MPRTYNILNEPSTPEAGDLRMNKDGAYESFDGLAWRSLGGAGTPGPQGPAGADGAQGPAGADGLPGADGAQGLPGADGAQGPQGTQGIQGVPGNDGAQGLPGNDGAAGSQGPQGIQGVPGNDGAAGSQGTQGIQGVPGADGAAGSQGIQGVPGNDGAAGAQGIQGIPGADGAQGIQGPQGDPGAPGATLHASLTDIATSLHPNDHANVILTHGDAAHNALTYEASGAVATHAAVADPHAGYVKENDANWIDLTDTGATTLHSHAGGGGAPAYLRVDFAVPVLAALAWTNMPAALSFLLSTATVGKCITKADLTNFTQCRLLVNKQATAGAAASKLILRYWTSFTQTAATFADIGASEVSVATNVQNQFLATAWINLVAGAKADVFVAVLGSGGDGTLDPAFGPITAEFR